MVYTLVATSADSGLVPGFSFLSGEVDPVANSLLAKYCEELVPQKFHQKLDFFGKFEDSNAFPKI